MSATFVHSAWWNTGSDWRARFVFTGEISALCERNNHCVRILVSVAVLGERLDDGGGAPHHAQGSSIGDQAEKCWEKSEVGDTSFV
jgi:hypothetical protein